MKIPFALSDTLSGMLKASTTTHDERKQIESALVFYVGQFRAMLREHAATDVAYSVQDAIDDAVERTRETSPHADKVQCRRGCCHCCRQSVAVTSSEAALLLRAVREDGVAIDWQRAERQAQVSDDEFHLQPVAERECVFLDSATGDCRVYNFRPGACRKYFVITEPDFCDLEKNPGKYVGRFFSPDAEIMQSALMTVDESGTLPAMLVKARDAAP